MIRSIADTLVAVALATAALAGAQPVPGKPIRLICPFPPGGAVDIASRAIAPMKDEGCEAVILDCTEIPIIITDTNSPLPTLDSTRLIARAALHCAVHGDT